MTASPPYSTCWRLSQPFTIFAKETGELCTPFVWKLPSGDLLITYSDDGDFFFARCRARRSRDGGQTWHDDGPMLGHGCIATINERVTRTHDMYSFAVKGSDPKRFIFRYRDSHDGGGTFGPVQFASYTHAGETQPRIREGVAEPQHTLWNQIILWEDVLTAAGWEKHEWLDVEAGFHGPSYFTRFIRLRDGSLAHIVNLRSDGESSTANWHLHLVRSTDEGESWQYLSRITPLEHPQGVRGNASEGCPVRLADGRIYVVYRYPPDARKVRQIWSDDDGLTWSEPTIIDDRVCGICPSVQKLSDGALMHLHGRPGMWLMFDPTGTGRGWEVDQRFDLTLGEDLSIRINAKPTLTRLDLLHYKRYYQPHYATFARKELFDGYYYSWENVNGVEVSPGKVLIVYDVQNWIETPTIPPRKAIRGVWATRT